MTKKIREQDEPKKIKQLDWRAEGEKIVFTIDGQDVAKIGRLSIIRLLMPGMIEKLTEDYFLDLLSTDFLSKYEVAMEHFNNNLNKVSEFLGIVEERLRRFLGSGYIENFRKSHSLLIDEQKAKLRQELFPIKKAEEPKPLKIDGEKVIELIEEGKLPNEISEILKVDRVGFINWLQDHRGSIVERLGGREMKGSDPFFIRI